jgi:hypothetical protein
MSLVDNVIISFDILEDCDARVAEINAWTREHAGQGQEFKDIGTTNRDAAVDELYGGAKFLETPLLIAAMNYMPEEDFLNFLATLPWRYPEHVQYIVKRDDDSTFEIVALGAKKELSGDGK